MIQKESRPSATSKLVKAWESKNAKRAVKASGVSLMALSLSACGSEDNTPFAQADIDSAVAAANAAAATAQAAAVAAEAAKVTAAETAQAAAEATTTAATAAKVAAEADAATAQAAQAAAETAQAAAETTATEATAAKVAAEAAQATAEAAVVVAEAAKTTAEAALAAQTTAITDAGFANLDALIAAYEAAVAPPVAQNFTLTTSVDTVSVAAGNASAEGDTYVAAFQNDGAGSDTGTLNVGDSINAGDGADSITIRASDEMTAALMPTLTGIETVNIIETAAATAHTGLSTWAADATLFTIAGSIDTELNDLAYATQTVQLSASSGNTVLAGTGTSATVNVNATTDGDLTVEDATTATLIVTGASTLSDIGNGDLTTLNVAGSGALTIEAMTEGVTTLNASANTGGVTLTGVDATATSVTGSSANDIIGTTGALDNDADSTSISGGEGTDTLVIDTDITDASAVTSIEVLELSVDGLIYDMDTITGLGSIVIATDGAGGVGNADTANIDDYDAGTITISDKNQADVDDGDTITVDIDIAEDFGEGDADSITVAIAATQEVGDDEEDFVVASIDIKDEGTGGENIETFNINVSGARGVTLSALDINEHGDTPVVNVDTSVALAMAGVTFETTTNDDDLGNTVSFAGSTGAVTYTVGDLGYSSDSDDVITGGAGSDTLSIDVAADDHSFTMSGFETITITDSNAGSMDLANTTGYTTITADGVTTGDLTVSNVATGTTLAVSVEGTATLNIDGATAGSTLSVTLDDTAAGVYEGGDTLDIGAEFTTVNFAIDEDDSDVDDITAVFDAASALTVNITGDDSTDDDLTLAFTIADTATNVAINAAVEVTMSTVADTLEDDITLTFAGSTDVVNLTVLDTQMAESDTTFIGGAGDSDVLILDIDDQSSAASVSGFETVTISDADGGTIDASDFTGVTTFGITATTGTLDVNDADGDTFEITNGGAVAITFDGSVATGVGLSVAISGADDVAASDIVVTDIETVTFTAEASQSGLDIDLSDDEVDTVSFIAEDDAIDITLAASDISGAETINLTDADGDVDLSAATLAADVDINLGADNNDVTIGLVAGSSQTITASTAITDTIVIDGFTAAGATGDVIDLSALGITGLGDLVFTDADLDADLAADDVAITAANAEYAGTIVLIDVVTADLTAANFSFA